LPTSNMSKAETACCKKMAGNCRMNTSQHPCCKAAKSRVESEAKVERVACQVLPYLAAAIEISFEPDVMQERVSTSKLGLPPPTPPCLNPILRI
jgi:hypothetical protein